MLNRDFKNILIIKPSSIGDVIHALPFLKALRERYPDAAISWLINRGIDEIIRNNPYLNEVILFERKKWGSFDDIGYKFKGIAEFLRELRRKQFDLVVDLQGLFRSGVIAYLSGASYRIGFANAREFSPIFYNYRVSHPPVEMHAVDRYLLIAKELGADITIKDFTINIPLNEEKYIDSLIGMNKRSALIAINPSARWETKMWPLNKYAELADRIASGLNAQIIFIGSRKDEERINMLSSLVKTKPINLCGKTNLLQLTALLKKTALLITNDSGPMHIAAAVETHVVAIFGPTRPMRTGPYGKGHIVLQGTLPCINCLKKRCRDLKCMEAISVNEVFNSAKELLK